jgi:hypothetical protein
LILIYYYYYYCYYYYHYYYHHHYSLPLLPLMIELEGPSRITPNDLAQSFTRVIGKPVRAVPVPRESWDALFRSQGMRNPEPRMRMLDGFNEGWIGFEGGGSKAIKGSTNAVDVMADLIANSQVLMSYNGDEDTRVSTSLIMTKTG